MILKLDHKKILQEAINQAKNPDDIPKVETLHQNLAHMTVALKELETRLIRVTGKMNRLNIDERDDFVVPLAECVSIIKIKITKTKDSINKFI